MPLCHHHLLFFFLTLIIISRDQKFLTATSPHPKLPIFLYLSGGMSDHTFFYDEISLGLRFFTFNFLIFTLKCLRI